MTDVRHNDKNHAHHGVTYVHSGGRRTWLLGACAAAAALAFTSSARFGMPSLCLPLLAAKERFGMPLEIVAQYAQRTGRAAHFLQRAVELLQLR